MSQSRDPNRIKMPADVDEPDKIAYGLTFRQLAILAAAAMLFYAAWQGLHTLVPIPVLLAGAVVLGGLVFGLAVSRRDGRPMDLWLLSAVRHSRAPKALATSDTSARTPDWVQAPPARVALPAPLRLPADAIGDDGQISLSGSTAGMVAATTLNLGLRTGDEQQALLESYGRWLNSLSTPTQVVVSAQPVDLRSHAATLADTAHQLPDVQLRAACTDHAGFLADLAERRDPLRRQVLVVSRAHPGEAAGARRRAEDTARALAALGVTARALDGAAVTAAVAAAADPYRPPRPGGLAAPDTVITAPGKEPPL